MIREGRGRRFGAGGQTGNGAIYAAQQNTSFAAIGVDTDQYFTIGDQYKGALLSSAMKLLTPGVHGLIKTENEGTFKGGDILGKVGLAPLPRLGLAKCSQAVKTRCTRSATAFEGSTRLRVQRQGRGFACK